MATLGDRGLVVGGVDEGCEVRHVQGEGGKVQAELGHHRGADRPFRDGELVGVQSIHGVPETTVVGGRGRHFGEPRPSCFLPPVCEAQLRARRDDPVQRRQRQVGPDRGGRVGTARPADLIDGLDDLQPVQDAPDRREVTELLVLRPAGAALRGACQPGHHLLGVAQVLLVHDPGLAVHPSGLHQVVVGLVPTLLPNNCWPIWVIHLPAHQVQHRHAHLRRSPPVFGPGPDQLNLLTIQIARKLPLVRERTMTMTVSPADTSTTAPKAPPVPRAMPIEVKAALVRWGTVIVAVLAWELITRGPLADNAYLAPPSVVATEGLAKVLQPDALADLWATTLRFLEAFAMVTLLGVPIGIAVGRITQAAVS